VNAFDVILLAIAATISAYLVLVFIVKAARPARRAGAHVRDTFTAPFSSHFDEATRERRFDRLDDELRHALGMDATADARARTEVVEAAMAAQQITVLNQHLHKSVTQCLNTHWAVAQGIAAVDMGEAARHPWCGYLRQRVIDLSELLSQHLERYPLILDAPELIRLQLGIRWIGPTCATCPYFTSTVQDAPRICPTAKAMGQRPSTGARPNGVVDGEIVEDCGGASR
jgi:hypothetical protein